VDAEPPAYSLVNSVRHVPDSPSRIGSAPTRTKPFPRVHVPIPASCTRCSLPSSFTGWSNCADCSSCGAISMTGTVNTARRGWLQLAHRDDQQWRSDYAALPSPGQIIDPIGLSSTA
jgi:hypothetical protein